MTKSIYYTPPSDEIFNEMKEKAIEVWSRYDNQYGYVTGKVNRIKEIQNIEDNFMYILGMFDMDNQRLLSHLLSPETKQAVRERLLAGGNLEGYINMIGF